MNAEHTPGKWEIRYMNAENTDDGESDFFVQAPKINPKMACNIEIMQQDFGEHTGYPRELKLADARLIAAAPELLAAVKALLATGLNGGNNVRLAYLSAKQTALSDEDLAKADKAEEALQMAYAAIAKATTPQ